MLHAAVIGIDRYADPLIRPLQCARRDAEAVAGLLRDRIRPEERRVHLLVDEEATRQRVTTVIGDEMARAVAPGDTVVLYFACHGSPEVQSAPDRESLYLIFHDTRYGEIFSTGADMQRDVVRWIERFASAKLVLVLLDTCFSGGAGGRTFEGPSLGADRRQGRRGDLTISLRDLDLGEGRLIFSAADDDQVALEDTRVGHGYFTQHLLRALQPEAGDAAAKGGAAATIGIGALYENVARAVRNVTGGKQVPVLNGRSSLAALPLFPAAVRAAGQD